MKKRVIPPRRTTATKIPWTPTEARRERTITDVFLGMGIRSEPDFQGSQEVATRSVDSRAVHPVIHIPEVCEAHPETTVIVDINSCRQGSHQESGGATRRNAAIA